MPSERHGDASDNVAHRGLGLFAGGHVAFSVRREAHAVGQERHRQVVDVVGDAVASSVDQGAGLGRPR